MIKGNMSLKSWKIEKDFVLGVWGKFVNCLSFLSTLYAHIVLISTVIRHQI